MAQDPPIQTEVLARCGPGGTDRLEVTRYTLAPGAVQEVGFPGEESFCCVIAGEGSLVQRQVGADWHLPLYSLTAVWMPPGFSCRMKNVGATPFTYVRFSVTLNECEARAEKDRPSAFVTFPITAIHADNVANFLSRVAFEGAPHNSKAFSLSEFETVLTGGSVPTHVHEAKEEIYYIIRGEGVATINGKRGVVKAGQIVHVPVRAQHGMKNESDDLLEYVLGQVPVA
jgi:mannose-6-phosphate isomerase-like protein (cupin superfamily)